ncbi:hypothetical protein [uncultured Thiodictyon sp.]|uniref:hypothetical protein n=1 Tax=uncultured Thiodictyon sp. TaxID=1846217 RepID=UPI0025F90294|nr:hypothetical protein [uncultured Thiodictyon sp.]
MDRNKFRGRLAALNMTPNGFADFAGWSRSTVREWGEGSPVPRPARCILELLESQVRDRFPGNADPKGETNAGR